MGLGSFVRLMLFKMLKDGGRPPEGSATAVQYDTVVDQVNALTDGLFAVGYDLMLVPTPTKRLSLANLSAESSIYVPASEVQALEARVRAMTDLLSDPEMDIMATKDVEGTGYPVEIPYAASDYVSEAEFVALESYVADLEALLSDSANTVFMVKGE